MNETTSSTKALVALILHVCATEKGVSVEDITSRTRRRDVFDARLIATHEMLRHGLSAADAAVHIRRHRTSVIYYRTRYDDLRKYSTDFRKAADEAARRIDAEVRSLARPERQSEAQPKPDYDAIFDKIQSFKTERIAALLERKRQESKRLIHQRMSDDAIFSLVYVPYIIVEVIWDYIDTMNNLAQLARLDETKKANRQIQQLHREYDQDRFRIINQQWRNGETDNMLMLQDGKKELFTEHLRRFEAAVRLARPGIDETRHSLVACAYIVEALIKCAHRYCSVQEKCLTRLVGYDVAAIMPKQVQLLQPLMRDYQLGIVKSDDVVRQQAAFAEELASFCCTIGFNDMDKTAHMK